jgi:hypothetical protein
MEAIETPDQFLLVEVGDIFDQLVRDIHWFGEQPIIHPERDHALMDAFMMDIFHQVGYLPFDSSDIGSNVGEVLDASPQYFNAPKLSSLQRRIWVNAAQQLVNRFTEFGLYGELLAGGRVNNYDYYCLQRDTLVLRVPNL